MIVDVMRETQPVGDRSGVADILPGATRPDALRFRTMIVELERHADHLGARPCGERGDDARIDSARHRDDDSPVLQRFGKLEVGAGEAVGGGNRLDHGRRHLGMGTSKYQLFRAVRQDIDAG